MSAAAPTILGIASLVIAPLASPAHAQHVAESSIASGDYGGDMLIGFDPASRIVSGYFQSYTGNRQFSCIFYLTGKLRGADSPIRTYFPETPGDAINGVLVRESREKFQVRLSEEHGGCWNVRHFAARDEPAAFVLRVAHPWIAVAVVKRDRAYFFDAPARAIRGAGHRKAYVVKGDGVGVRAARQGWLQVDFVGSTKPVSGWIRQSDVYPAH